MGSGKERWKSKRKECKMRWEVRKEKWESKPGGKSGTKRLGMEAERENGEKIGW